MIIIAAGVRNKDLKTNTSTSSSTSVTCFKTNNFFALVSLNINYVTKIVIYVTSYKKLDFAIRDFGNILLFVTKFNINKKLIYVVNWCEDAFK